MVLRYIEVQLLVHSEAVHASRQSERNKSGGHVGGTGTL